ncbi:alpha/beta fold hydrolase [Limnohabitans sp. T6-20]|uniref:alpha/beta hydrolase n=1 Tax=Limnohabitans sp. T6-20 TaxID=1100725 RepID=UPI000D377E0A|nr:alpha/beta hydrolase [Limnohabitans sp. T6-20]PUE10057.1 alpha/beta hydrolase [Limnohabitans sp. T6-20]
MPRIIFSHGNSFPASTYKVMFDNLRQRGFTVDAVEKYGHDPKYPVTNNWPHLVDQLADFAREKQVDGEPAFLVGHSLGGILSLMCAARHPELARGVLMIDSPVLGGWRATTLGLAKRTSLVGSVSPGRISQKRRNHWPSLEAALDNFSNKKAFAKWDPQVLRDYIEHGTRDEGGQRVLNFDRDVETAIYNSLPHKLDSLLKRKPLKCPVSFIGGTHSAEMRQAGAELTHKVVKGRIMMLDGSHLFPMEKPLATAAAIEAALRNLGV